MFAKKKTTRNQKKGRQLRRIDWLALGGTAHWLMQVPTKKTPIIIKEMRCVWGIILLFQ